MPRGPKGEKRPADTHAAAINVARIAVAISAPPQVHARLLSPPQSPRPRH
jgi:hypothetical protein